MSENIDLKYLNGKTILVTGATSMIGAALVGQSVLNGVRVVAFVRSDSLRLSRLPKSDLITLIKCDLNEFVDFHNSDNIPEKIDVFYHAAWEGSDKKNRNSCDVQLRNIQYTLDAVRLAKKFGCKRFVGIGAQTEYGLSSKPLNAMSPTYPKTAHGVTKYAAGILSKIECEQLNIEYVWVRIFSIYGTMDHEDRLVNSFISNCKNNIAMDLSPCTHIWDYLYEDDAGKALLLLGEKGINGKTYCLGSGIGRPLMEYLEIIKDIVNPNYVCGYGKIPYTKESIRYLCAEISDLVEDTGWRPEIKFDEGIGKILASAL
jgi:nucleoside-diphosphate-sugar epimerase